MDRTRASQLAAGLLVPRPPRENEGEIERAGTQAAAEAPTSLTASESPQECRAPGEADLPRDAQAEPLPPPPPGDSELYPSPPRTLRLRENFAWTLAGSAFYHACQWGVLVVLARLEDAETVGRFALALALSAPVMIFANLHLRAVLVTDAGGEHTFAEYLGLRLVASTVGFVLIA